MVRPTLSVVPAGEGWTTEPANADAVRQEEPGEDFEPGSLTSLIGDSEWTTRAVCAGSDPDALFVTGAAQREAARLCQACPVRLE